MFNFLSNFFSRLSGQRQSLSRRPDHHYIVCTVIINMDCGIRLFIRRQWCGGLSASFFSCPKEIREKRYEKGTQLGNFMIKKKRFLEHCGRVDMVRQGDI
jgi:hypothetical protein